MPPGSKKTVVTPQVRIAMSPPSPSLDGSGDNMCVLLFLFFLINPIQLSFRIPWSRSGSEDLSPTPLTYKVTKGSTSKSSNSKSARNPSHPDPSAVSKVSKTRRTEAGKQIQREASPTVYLDDLSVLLF